MQEINLQADELAETAEQLRMLVARFQLEAEAAASGRPERAGGPPAGRVEQRRRADDWRATDVTATAGRDVRRSRPA